ncbi:fimbrial protein [Paraburkholderia solisilvae]|nr:fimbrial protein [Paraburkholderia solisilvae]
MPASLNMPNNAPVGTLLTNVVTTPATSYFQCSAPVGSGAGAGVGVMAVGLTKALSAGIPLIVNVNGTLLSVFATNVAGVGIAVGVRIVLPCAVTTFQDLGQTLNAPFPSPWFGQFCLMSSATMATGVQVEAALVKTGTASAGTVSAGIILQAASFIGTSTAGQVAMQTGSNAPGLISFSLSPVKAPVRSCTTPDVTVTMGQYRTAQFKGVGSVTPGVAFNLALTNCSAGISQIQYQLSAPAGARIAAQGVINLSSDSSARGIGLQIVDGGGVPLKLDNVYSVSGVNGTASSYLVPFKAAYYQTDASVTAGTANANLTFTITYP